MVNSKKCPVVVVKGKQPVQFFPQLAKGISYFPLQEKIPRGIVFVSQDWSRTRVNKCTISLFSCEIFKLEQSQSRLVLVQYFHCLSAESLRLEKFQSRLVFVHYCDETFPQCLEMTVDTRGGGVTRVWVTKWTVQDRSTDFE